MMRAFKFLAVLIALLCLVSCGKGVSGGAPSAHAEAPLFSPAEGTYESAQVVSLLCGTEGASIHYTTDGSTPTTASPVFTAAIAVRSSKTLKAISAKTGMSNSAVASATYTINTPAITEVYAPSFSPEGGTYNSAQEVSLTSATPGAVIYYTTNGSAPSDSGIKYSGPISVTEDVTIKAIAVKSGMTDSEVASAAYNIDIALPMAEAPVFSPPPGLYDDYQVVTIETATPEARILYTTNGTAPNSSSDVYSGPIEVLFNTTIKAIAVKDGYADSSVKNATYIIDNPPPVVATPVFTPDGGRYEDDQTVTISTTTPGATIYYTMNGTVPTQESPVYSSPLLINSTTTIKAVAVRFGWTTSSADGIFIIENGPVPGELWADPISGIELVWVPAGTFMMGDEFSEGQADEKPPRRVTLTKGFWMGKYEVTQSQWVGIAGENPSYFNFDDDSPNRPVEQISWEEVTLFIAQLNISTGQNYRLPTEAEWEYSAKAGRIPGTRYSGTSDISQLKDYAWYGWLDLGETHPVGQKLPNDFGLYDMSGNVYEYVSDWYSGYDLSQLEDPQGPTSGAKKVMRGGSYYGNYTRNSDRGSVFPEESMFSNIGFRLIREQ